jgi:uncharacterized protein with ParB-like and HNH nuclease domain
VLPREKGFHRELIDGERALGAFILPPFQRQPVWTLEQKIRLIASFLDELPIPPYVVNRDLEPPYTHERWVIDGQQRITAVLEFIQGTRSRTAVPRGTSAGSVVVPEPPISLP